MTLRPSRREMLAAAVGTGAGMLSGVLPRRVAEVLAATPPACGTLRGIEHVVIFIQENRSFDHYFGSYRGVRGWNDAAATHRADGHPVYEQPLPAGQDFGTPHGYLLPFHLDTARTRAECTNDITHEWGAQHRCWNGGLMDRWALEHFSSDGAGNGALTMGYYTRADLTFFHALADAFTIGDGYHCSVIGPTDPNRLYSVTGMLDPDGGKGGPILHTYFTDRYKKVGTLTWSTMPEQLSARDVSWKVYSNPDGNLGDNVLAYFKNYVDGSHPDLAANAFTPTFPGQFQADVLSGTLPQVSWILAPLVYSEHPPAPPDGGQYVVSQVLRTLSTNPGLWSRTALFVTYDENGGFYDHVPPPVAPPGTAGEWLTVKPLPSDAEQVAGPIGLGFRVPLLVVSPYSRGGLVCSDTFDHTSLLRFLETRFGVEVPNLSAWRRSVTGDLTAVFNFAAPDASIPPLPQPGPADPVVVQQCVPAAALSEVTNGKSSPLLPPYPVPPNSAPSQQRGKAGRPSGPGGCATRTASPPGGTGGNSEVLGAQSVTAATATALPMTAAAPTAMPGIAASVAVVGGVAWIARRRRRLAEEASAGAQRRTGS